jgi:serine/threonine-protein kinase
MLTALKISPQEASAWARISPYLDQALELEPGVRETWLKNLETTQPDIARAVHELLSEHAALEAKGFLSGAPTLKSLGVPGPQEGMVLGSYRLLKEIGAGGMSSVWLGERCDGILKREVALKLPFEGPRRAQIAERFQREREILATLTHPNIATLYDAGISASGQSYLAMELVKGKTLTEHCDAARLSVSQRLRLFLQVLSAVEFAHTQLVLHRDLKPSNILVSDQDRVVLLDFGIAKLLEREADPARPLTEMAAPMLTPDYASPEHLSGQFLGTTSDVYSLGVVLYELLTGVRPFVLKDGSRAALEEAVIKQDPLPPSRSVPSDEVASARQTTSRKLAHTLSGDLDTIILKALKKKPTDRYRSAGAFAQDISCYLQNLPVSARPDSRAYRAVRFITRHKLQVSAAAITLLAIVSGGVLAVWQAKVAESQARAAALQARVAAQERDKAVALMSRNAAMNDFVTLLITEAGLSAEPMTVSEMLNRSEQLVMANPSEDKADRAATMGMLANLIYTGTGNIGKAAELLERALALSRDSADSDLRARLICDHAVLTATADAGKADSASRAIEHELRNADLNPLIASSCLAYLSDIAQSKGEAPAALEFAEQSLARFQKSSRRPVADEGAILSRIANAFYVSGQNLQADRYYEQALRKFAAAGRDRGPAVNILINNWAQVSNNAGVPKRALEWVDRVLSSEKDSGFATSPQTIIVFNRARSLQLLGRYTEAKAAYEQSARLAHESKIVNFEFGSWLGLAEIAEQSGDRVAVRRDLSEARAVAAPSWPANHPGAMRRLALEGRIDLSDGKLAQAGAKFDQVLTSKRASITKLNAALGKAEVALLAHDAEAALAQSKAALEMSRSLQGDVPYSCHTGLAWLMLARSLQLQGDVSQVRKAYETAIAHLSNTVDADHPELLRARRMLESTFVMKGALTVS